MSILKIEDYLKNFGLNILIRFENGMKSQKHKILFRGKRHNINNKFMRNIKNPYKIQKETVKQERNFKHKEPEKHHKKLNIKA